MTDKALNETVEINLDVSKLLGFQTLSDLGADAAALSRALDDTHNKIGVGGEMPSGPGGGGPVPVTQA